MQAREWVDETLDKAEWGEGPWLEEPDKVQWPDPATGLPCLIVRGGGGALCGYVGVGSGHPWHGVKYHEIDRVSVHGGLTYSDRCQPGPENATICHVVDEGEDDDVWWVGFDTGHYNDLAPGHAYRLKQIGHDDLIGRGTYKPLWYVRDEVTMLAQQAKEAAL